MTTRYRPNTFNPFKLQDNTRKAKQTSKIRNCACPSCGEENVLTEQEVKNGSLCCECECEIDRDW